MWVIGIECLPDQRPGRDNHQGRNSDDHDKHPLLKPVALIDQVESGIEDQKLCRSVYSPSSQEKKCVYRPERLWVRQEVLQDDPDRIDGTAPDSK